MKSDQNNLKKMKLKKEFSNISYVYKGENFYT